MEGTYFAYDQSKSRFAGRRAEASAAGVHLWCVFATFEVLADSIDAVLSGEEQGFLNSKNLIDIAGPGCLICEQRYVDAKNMRCPGEPVSYHTDGTPVYRTHWPD